MNDLKERVQQFQRLKLPGQPTTGMHMETIYLVQDLWAEIEQLRADIKTWRITAAKNQGVAVDRLAEIKRLEADNARLRAALEVCAADWISAPGTAISAAQNLSAEFRRRMEIANAALGANSETQEARRGWSGSSSGSGTEGICR